MYNRDFAINASHKLEKKKLIMTPISSDPKLLPEVAVVSSTYAIAATIIV